MPFIPHTQEDIDAMLNAIGVDEVEQLFDEIPDALKIKQLEHVPSSINEMTLARLMHNRAARDLSRLCFIGAGSYEHHIPAAVWELTTRGEFMTAYTPYQAEASQGNLQLIYEYQTMIASLLGLDVANASLYDGASALAEAILMAVRANRKIKSRKVLMPQSLHPHYRQVVASIVKQQQIELIELPYCPQTGTTRLEELHAYNDVDICALVIPQPNFFGMLEDVDQLTDWAQAKNCLSIAVINPIAMNLLKEPGKWGQQGVDIACGEGQPLGIPMASGGPYFGLLACKQQYVRQMPGRIVGRTVDVEGKTGYTLTLQAREQHIRRSKATSNICTNQGLMVTAATIYMSLLGPTGLAQVASACYQNSHRLAGLLAEIDGVELVFGGHFFHEAVVRLPYAINEILEELAKHGVQGGYDLSKHYPELGNALLVCATETKTEQDLQEYYDLLNDILKRKKNAEISQDVPKQCELK